MKKKIVAIVAAAVLAAATLPMTGCASWNRMVKSIGSDMAGGMNRTVILYDYEGEMLHTWNGWIDIRQNESGQTMFDLDGKRVLIDGGIVVSEEQ